MINIARKGRPKKFPVEEQAQEESTPGSVQEESTPGSVSASVPGRTLKVNFTKKWKKGMIMPETEINALNARGIRTDYLFR